MRTMAGQLIEPCIRVLVGVACQVLVFALYSSHTNLQPIYSIWCPADDHQVSILVTRRLQLLSH